MESYVECNTDFGSFTYVTGDESSALTASAVYTHSSTDQDVYLNKLQAGTTGKYTFLHIGTSDGKLQKVSQFVKCIYMYTLSLKLNHYKQPLTRLSSTVSNVSDYRCISDCRSRGRKFDPGLVPYFLGD